MFFVFIAKTTRETECCVQLTSADRRERDRPDDPPCYEIYELWEASSFSSPSNLSLLRADDRFVEWEQL